MEQVSHDRMFAREMTKGNLCPTSKSGRKSIDAAEHKNAIDADIKTSCTWRKGANTCHMPQGRRSTWASLLSTGTNHNVHIALRCHHAASVTPVRDNDSIRPQQTDDVFDATPQILQHSLPFLLNILAPVKTRDSARILREQMGCYAQVVCMTSTTDKCSSGPMQQMYISSS